jgi:hypothetical protein
MSKLTCGCGNTLSDTDQESHEKLWGIVATNLERDNLRDNLANLLAGLCIAYASGNHLEWLRKNIDVYQEQNLESIIHDIILSQDSKLGLTYGICQKCGGLMIQKEKNDNRYAYYSVKQIVKD